jgi:hypothetical protein
LKNETHDRQHPREARGKPFIVHQLAQTLRQIIRAGQHEVYERNADLSVHNHVVGSDYIAGAGDAQVDENVPACVELAERSGDRVLQMNEHAV